MSNAVDILVCDGPHAGRRYCQSRPVPVAMILEDEDGDDWTYYTWAYENRYWIAVVDINDLSAVAAMIAAHNWQPSWDLLRALGEHP